MVESVLEDNKIFSLLFAHELEMCRQREITQGSFMLERMLEGHHYLNAKYCWQCSDSSPTAQVDSVVKRYRTALDSYKALCVLTADELYTETESHRALLSEVRERIQAAQRKVREELSVDLFGNRYAGLDSIVRQEFRHVIAIDPCIPPSYDQG